MDYDKYYQKGGHYEIPTEVFNDLLEQQSQLQQQKEELIKFIKEELSAIDKPDSNYEKGIKQGLEYILSKLKENDKNEN